MRLHLSAVFLLFVCMMAPVSAQNELRDVAAKMVKDMVTDTDVTELKGQKILISEFRNINGKGDAVPQIFQEMLTTSFIKDKTFKVVERAQLEKALNELKIGTSGLVDPDNAKKVGKMLGAAYMVVGSISDIGGSVSIDARIVSIETGESVTAADATVGTAGTASTPVNANPAGKIDTSQQANDDTAGQTVGQLDNLGLLGGTKFKIAWRERLGAPALAFASGNLIGDGYPRLALICSSQYSGEAVLSSLKWSENNFKQIWSQRVPCYDYDSCYLEVMPSESQRDAVLCSLPVSKGSYVDYTTTMWLWNGATYQNLGELGLFVTDTVHDSLNKIVGRVVSVVRIADVVVENGKPMLANLRGRSYGSPDNTYTAADLDADGKTEIAVVEFSNQNGKPIRIFDLEDKLKAEIVGEYGGRLTTWLPGNIKTPYLVARKNNHDTDGHFTGGYVKFIQWKGESYEDVWISSKMNDYVIDIQVCDPKGEGKDGLVILSRDKKGCYLTKIVAQ